MIESCMVAVPTQIWPQCERPTISLRKTNGMNGSPPPPISLGWPIAHRPRRLASFLSRAKVGPVTGFSW